MQIIELTDNSNCSITDNHKENLARIANKRIKSLVDNNPDLLVFPDSFSDCDDLDKDALICSLNDENIYTNNIMGFVGVNDTQLSITSRFYSNKNDHFLHFMLQKVFNINLFDLKVNNDNEHIWDILLLFIFPYYLKKAINQGLYKEYVRKEYNNANVKGAINIPAHLKFNIPFNGKVAYKTREYAYDNKLTQLIRHTIEVIKRKGYVGILSNEKQTRDAVNEIVFNTNSYQQSDKQAIIFKNIKPLSHPYFYEYEPLRKLCIKILRGEGLSFQKKEKDKVHGILFDGAWLWEEFLNTYLKQKGFTHPENRNKTKALHIFTNRNGNKRYPDFYKDNHVVDAKYKRLIVNEKERLEGNEQLIEKEGVVNSDDLNKMVMYLYITKASRGTFIYPTQNDFYEKEKVVGTLNGYGGEIYTHKIAIPKTEHVDFKTFSEKMEDIMSQSLNSY